MGEKANSADVYLKTETYNRTEIDNALANKANSADVYTKTNIDTKLSAINTDISALETKDTQHDSAISALQTSDTEQDTAISGINQTITSIQSKDTEQDSAISALQTKDSQHDSSISALQAKDTQQDTAISQNTQNISNLTAKVDNTVVKATASVSGNVIVLAGVSALSDGITVTFSLPSTVATPQIQVNNTNYPLKDTNNEAVEELIGGVCHSLTYAGGNFFTKSSKGGGLEINGIIQNYLVQAGSNVNAGDFVEFINSGDFKYALPVTFTTQTINGVANTNGTEGQEVEVWVPVLTENPNPPEPTTDYEKLTSGEAYKYYEVGDTLTIAMDGWGDVLFDVVGKNHDVENSITVVPRNVLMDNADWNDAGTNNYSSSSMRQFLNNSVLGKFDQAIQDSIKAVPKECHDRSTAVTCTDKVWLLSYTEVGFSGSSYAPVEGTNYGFWADNASRIKTYNGTTTIWWLRTPNTNYSYYAWYVYTSGAASANYVTNTYGLVFGLVF